MSHYTLIETQLVSKKHLVMALHDMGLRDVEVFDQAQPLIGWLGEKRKNRAQVIIRKRYLEPASNDMGFLSGSDGRFRAVISDFDQRKYNMAWLRRLTQRYAYHVARDSLKEQGFEMIEETVEQDRTIHLTLRRMA